MGFGFRSLVGRLPIPRFSEEISDLEELLSPVLRKMEKRGIGIDLKKLESFGSGYQKELDKLSKKIFKDEGEEFNILSPKQAKQHPDSLELIKKYRSAYKLKSSYVDSLPKLVKKDGKIHTTYKALGAETGRLSSSEPNLQNIPKVIKPVFVASSGKVLISVDYSQIELRIVASISEDEKLMEAFKKDRDVHKMTAANLFNKTPSKVTSYERQQAKTLNFSIIYGISAFGLAKANDMPVEEAHAFIAEYLNDFRGVANYILDMKKQARDNGYVETLLGRKRHIDLKTRGWDRIAINHPIQGSQADIIKLAMIKLDKEVKGALMLLQVHDELVFEASKKDYKKFIPKIREIMEGIYPLKIPLKVDVKVGKDWGEMKLI